MSRPSVDEVLESGMPDIRGLPLDDEITIDDAEYAHIMRRITEDEPEASVSAFNSSI